MSQTIAFDAASNTSTSGASPMTWSHTCTGSNRALVVVISQTTGGDVSAVTYNGTAMTQVDISNFTGTKQLYTYLLLAPASGAHTVSISFTSTNLSAVAASYTGVKQASGPDAHNKFTGASSTSYAESLSSVADNCWHISGVGGSNPANAISAGASTTVRQHTEANQTVAIADTNALITPAGSNTLNFSSPGAMSWGSNGLTLAPEPDIYTLTAAQGSYTYTGVAATLYRVLTLTAAAGSYAYTGIAATLTLIQIWINGTKNTTALSNTSKTTTSVATQSKNSTAVVNTSKNTTAVANQSKNSTSVTNQTKI